MDPVIETERLILRRPVPQDHPAFAAYFMSDRARFTGGQPDPILAWNRFCVTLGHWPMRGYGVLTMVLRDTGAAVGAAGPFYPEGWPEPEIAWQIWDAAAEGRGLAREAAEAARDWAYGALGWTTAASLIAPGNLRSQALARRLGCVRERVHPHPHFGPLEVWRHPVQPRSAQGSVRGRP
ncbi:MAG TPA: GNAT family N-acetyltransferase [Paracoccaceae bacterium]|nr:GNAT family N-acetyltransferase [Paracoccaceae bacterium]